MLTCVLYACSNVCGDMCVWVQVHMYAHTSEDQMSSLTMPLEAPGIRSPGADVTGCCKPPDMDVENQS